MSFFPCLPLARSIVLVKNINVAQTQFWVLLCMFWACTWATLLSPVMHVLRLYLGNTFESCYARFWACNGWGLYPLQAQTVHNRTRMCVWEAPNTCCSDQWAIREKRSTRAFVLPIIVFHQPSLWFIMGHKCQQQDHCWLSIMWHDVTNVKEEIVRFRVRPFQASNHFPPFLMNNLYHAMEITM